MKKKSKANLQAFCFRPKAYREKIPEITWNSRWKGTSRPDYLVEEFSQASTNICFNLIKVRDLPIYCKNHSILCLDDHMGKTFWDPYFPLAVDLCKVDGKIMAIPEDFTPFGLFARHDLLANYGFKPAQTLEELREQLIVLKEKTGVPALQIESGGIYTRLGFLTSLLSSFGIDLSRKLEDWSEQSDQMVEAYDWIRTLHLEGLISNLDIFVLRLNQLPMNQRMRAFGENLFYSSRWVGVKPLLWKNAGKDIFDKTSMSLMPPACKEAATTPQPFSAHGWVIPKNCMDIKTAVNVLQRTQDHDLIKENELNNNSPFTAWQTLWDDPDMHRTHPFYDWVKILRTIKKGYIVSSSLRKFELLDESFRFAIRQDLDGSAWVRTLFTHEVNTSRKMTTNNVVQEALNYIEQNLGTIRDVSQIATHVNMSSNYFSQFFQRKMKIGCGAYLKRIRMERAKKLLKEGKLSVKQISSSLGFRYPQAFTRAFRKHFRQSPLEFTRK